MGRTVTTLNMPACMCISMMAVEGPVPGRVGGQVEGHLAAGRDVDRVLEGLVPGGAAGHQFEEMAVQVDGVGHHGVVDQGHAHPLVALEADRLDQLR